MITSTSGTMRVLTADRPASFSCADGVSVAVTSTRLPTDALKIINRIFFAAVFLAIGIVLGVYLALWGGSVALSDARAYTDAAIAAHESQPLDCNTLVIQRWETADGVQVCEPTMTPLWSYVQTPDRANAANLSALERAMEFDIHAGDATWHRTHEHIDGHTWGDD
jgi:hypothetical protein